MSAVLSHRILLHILFFASGAAGLIFELIWFRLAGLSFGNTVWASTAVLAAFMGGLALGNALAGSAGLRFGRALPWYALLEALIAAGGLALLWLLPLSSQIVAEYADLPGLRPGLAFLLMLIPTTAMGMTLPLIIRALYAEGRYGSLLGRLYGVNTLGAVSGVIAAEYILVGWLGITGSALFAAGLNLAAAGIALWLAGSWPSARESRSHKTYPISLGGRWLLAAALSGALLLALEVVWFRLLLLQVRGTASAFAAMLAIVLAGIALGGLLASLLLRYQQINERTRGMSAVIAAGSAVSVVIGYQFLPLDVAASPWLPGLILMAGTALGSGMLFTLLAASYAQVLPEPSRATGRILVANTAGGMLGAALGGLLLLPLLGVEHSLLLLTLGYLLCAGFILPGSLPKQLTASLVATGLILFAFPWGQMQRHLDAASQPWRSLDDSKVVYQREGLNETVQLLQRELFGEPLAHRVVTNGDSMSGTERDSRRYMKLFAWLPMALHPGIKDSLLISYGLGSTAEALVADPGISNITVVDISPEILEASRLIHLDGVEPLDDPRVTVHIEDGRHFLLTSKRQFDLITGEPPPPRLAGIVNLYTQEYFRLMHARLKPGGLASYWLPVDQLTLDSSRAILAAFCSAFTDCSLWSGSNYNWILLGSRGGMQPVSEAQLIRLWHAPGTRHHITALGFEEPAQLGASFIADAGQIQHWLAGHPPLSDDFPKRLDEAGPSADELLTYADWLDSEVCKKRFSESAQIQRLWPATMLSRSLAWFDLQPILNNEVRGAFDVRLRLIDGILEHTELKIPLFWLLNSGIREQKIIDRLMKETGYRPAYAWHLAARALADRRYSIAATQFRQSHDQGQPDALDLALLSHCRAGETAAAEALASEAGHSPPLRCW